MTVTIIDYGVGNVSSIANIVRHIGSTATVSSDLVEIRDAEQLILPGVGAFDAAREKMIALGIDNVLRDCAAKGTPILGICLGMQLLTNGSEEGKRAGLGLVDASASKFVFSGNQNLRIPHMGWNYLRPRRNSVLFDVESNSPPRFYFVHSYYVTCANDDDVVGVTEYGHEFTSAFQHGNVFGVQFHPEKSHKYGMELFRRFLAYRPS